MAYQRIVIGKKVLHTHAEGVAFATEASLSLVGESLHSAKGHLYEEMISRSGIQGDSPRFPPN